MQRPIDEDAFDEVLLHVVHEVVVLELDALEELGGAVEVLGRRLGVAVHLVLGGDGGGRLGDHAHEEPVGCGEVEGGVGVVEGEGAVTEELDVLGLYVVPVRGEVLHAALVGALCLDGVAVEVGDLCDSGVRGLAVVALQVSQVSIVFLQVSGIVDACSAEYISLPRCSSHRPASSCNYRWYSKYARRHSRLG